MHKSQSKYLAFAVLLSACTGGAPHINVVCEENSVGNCIIKWETSPLIAGDVKVYASTSPNHVSEETEVASAPIADQHLTVVTANPRKRYYYTLLFNDKYRVKVASRNVNIPGIQNFRDMGGYHSYSTRKEIRWGMLYRSGQLETAGQHAFRKLKNLGIKTVIDLRTPLEAASTPTLPDHFNVVHIPLPTIEVEPLLKGIQQKSIRSDTVYRIVERMERTLVMNSTDEFRRLFDVLLNEDNYPLVIHCTTGIGRTGLASALILFALGVDSDMVMDDYRLSNIYYNIPRASRYVYSLPVRSQEAVTTLYSARENYLNAAKNEIESHYGNIDTYLESGVGLSKEEIKKLQHLLLTDKNRL
ncbi:MAG: tyrosine-protein phosphatase [Prevotellaceae bacterium]|jgi:protein-tyrosine phosphatase|nr:tyrosine-protein phosphatase [Prevotellaceae bacterium]